MISYGSQRRSAEMPCDNRSHQLGEGQSINTEMSGVVYPSRLVYGRNTSRSQQRQTAIDTFHQLGKGQGEYTGMSVVVHPSRQLGEGHEDSAKMSIVLHPSRPVYGSQSHTTAMSHCAHSHQLGEGHRCGAAMPTWTYPPRPVFGSRNHNAAMPMEKRSHLFTRGQLPFAELSHSQRLSREGSSWLRRNATFGPPFPTSLREPIELRRNANLNYLPPVLTRGQSRYAAMPRSDRLLKEGS